MLGRQVVKGRQENERQECEQCLGGILGLGSEGPAGGGFHQGRVYSSAQGKI